MATQGEQPSTMRADPGGGNRARVQLPFRADVVVAAGERQRDRDARQEQRRRHDEDVPARGRLGQRVDQQFEKRRRRDSRPPRSPAR